jgi:hypothetical protein
VLWRAGRRRDCEDPRATRRLSAPWRPAKLEHQGSLYSHKRGERVLSHARIRVAANVKRRDGVCFGVRGGGAFTAIRSCTYPRVSGGAGVNVPAWTDCVETLHSFASSADALAVVVTAPRARLTARVDRAFKAATGRTAPIETAQACIVKVRRHSGLQHENRSSRNTKVSYFARHAECPPWFKECRKLCAQTTAWNAGTSPSRTVGGGGMASTRHNQTDSWRINIILLSNPAAAMPEVAHGNKTGNTGWRRWEGRVGMEYALVNSQRIGPVERSRAMNGVALRLVAFSCSARRKGDRISKRWIRLTFYGPEYFSGFAT